MVVQPSAAAKPPGAAQMAAGVQLSEEGLSQQIQLLGLTQPCKELLT
jgi:hypothetical protein